MKFVGVTPKQPIKSDGAVLSGSVFPKQVILSTSILEERSIRNNRCPCALSARFVLLLWEYSLVIFNLQ